MSSIISLLLSNTAISQQFFSTHWKDGRTDFINNLERGQVRAVYIPFRQNNPLFNISMELKSSASNVEPVTEIIPTTVKTNIYEKSTDSYIIPLPVTEDVENERYVKCENLLKTYVNNNEALKFETQVYAIQLANTTLKIEDLK